MTSSYLNRNVVISSIQTSGETYPSYQASEEAPKYRANGGDLVAGDVYYNSVSNIYYTYSGKEWVVIGGPGLFDEILNRLDSIEARLDLIES